LPNASLNQTYAKLKMVNQAGISQMISSPRPASACFVILFLFQRFARIIVTIQLCYAETQPVKTRDPAHPI
jgi:hypothetical protein